MDRDASSLEPNAPGLSPELPPAMRLIWAAFLATVVLYGALVPVIARGRVAMPAAGLLAPAFAAMALGIGGFSLWWRRRFTSAAAAGIDPNSPRTALPPLQVGCIVCWAMHYVEEAGGSTALRCGPIGGRSRKPVRNAG